MAGFRVSAAGLLLVCALACCRSVPPPLKSTDPFRTDAVRVVSATPLAWPEAIDADRDGNLYFSDHWGKKLYRLVRATGTGEGRAFRQETLLTGLAHISGVSIDRKEETLYLGAQMEGDDNFGILTIPLCRFDEGPFPVPAIGLKGGQKKCLAKWVAKKKEGRPNGVVVDPVTKDVYYTVTGFSPLEKGYVGSVPGEGGGTPEPIDMETPNGIDLWTDPNGGETRILIARTGYPPLKKGGGVLLDSAEGKKALPGFSQYNPDGVYCMKNGDVLAAGFASGKILYLQKDKKGYHEAVTLPICQDLGAPTDLVVADASSGAGKSLFVTTTTPWQLFFPKKNLNRGRVLEIPHIDQLIARVQRASPAPCNRSVASGAGEPRHREAVDAFRRLRRDLGRKDPVFTRENLSGPLLFAHRGGVLEAPESTARAFCYALDVAGADVLELDVQITKDGRFVVWHGPGMDNVFIEGEDPDPGKRPEKRRRIDDFSWDDLEKTAWVADPGTIDLTTVPRCNDRRLLLLEDFLRRFPDAPLNIEMKSTFKKALGKRDGLSDNIAAFRRILVDGRGNRTVVVASADACILKAFRAADDGRFPTNLAFCEQLSLKFASPSLENRVLETTYLGFFSGAGMVEKVHGQGRAVYVFITGFGPVCALDRCLEDEALFEILDRGVDGIMTDRPLAVRDAMHRWLKRKAIP